MTETLEQLSARIEQLAEEADLVASELERQNDLVALLSFFSKLKEEYAALDGARKKFYHALNKLDKEVLPKMFEDSGMDKVRIPELERSFYPLSKGSASMVDKVRAYEWLRQNGADHLITETVNSSTLAAFVKDMIQECNVEPPADVIKYNPYTIIGSSKYTPK